MLLRRRCFPNRDVRKHGSRVAEANPEALPSKMPTERPSTGRVRPHVSVVHTERWLTNAESPCQAETRLCYPRDGPDVSFYSLPIVSGADIADWIISPPAGLRDECSSGGHEASVLLAALAMVSPERRWRSRRSDPATLDGHRIFRASGSSQAEPLERPAGVLSRRGRREAQESLPLSQTVVSRSAARPGDSCRARC